MRRFVLSILIAAVLVALVTGCSGMQRYDGRLVAADSLMWNDPDSALATLTAIDSLASEGDRAYRDLLLTQARYKAYQPITARDDSAITRAIAWYSTHSSEREKLTRAYLYKGAVMEELDHIDSAMYYYKTAEATADLKDYLNLGQINTRIGYLYNVFYADEQTSYEKHQQAYHYYLLSANKEYQLNSLYQMFLLDGITRQENPKEHEKLYSRAILLAIELADHHILFDLYESRCRQLSRQEATRQEAKQIALKCLRDYNQYVNNDLLLDLAYLYTKDNKQDSAKFFVNYVDESQMQSPSEKLRIRVRKYEILALIAESGGKSLLAYQFRSKEAQSSDSILNNTQNYEIEKIENRFNRNRYTNAQSRVSGLLKALYSLSVIAILLLVFGAIKYLHRRHRTRTIIKAMSDTDLCLQMELLDQLEDKSSVIGHLLDNLLILIRLCSDPNTQNTTLMAQQIKETVVDVANEDFWIELRAYLDKKHNGIISNLQKAHNLKEKDMRFIELSCCGFSYIVIALIMDYSPNYVLNKRKILARKMHLDMPLQKYLESLMGSSTKSNTY